MRITSVSINKVEKEESKILGFASVLIDDAFAVHDIRIVDGDNGPFLAMPSRKTAEGKFKDVAHPINADTRKIFETAILEEYNKQS